MIGKPIGCGKKNHLTDPSDLLVVMDMLYVVLGKTGSLKKLWMNNNGGINKKKRSNDMVEGSHVLEEAEKENSIEKEGRFHHFLNQQSLEGLCPMALVMKAMLIG
ncbi:hypothetical protein L1887_11204 [Cichorium endivia]|nr:hypothetical protein L1887_11204 [Cichorium endivia]